MREGRQSPVRVKEGAMLQKLRGGAEAARLQAHGTGIYSALELVKWFEMLVEAAKGMTKSQLMGSVQRRAAKEQAE